MAFNEVEKILFKSCIKNNEFLEILKKESEKDPFDNINSEQYQRNLLHTFFGYMIGKHGSDWRKFL